MNRQAKIRGTDRWMDMGAVSIENAAADFAERQNLTADTLFVTVRDDDDLVEHELTVEAFRAFRVTGLRGGE
jgi:hypothetical protein